MYILKCKKKNQYSLIIGLTAIVLLTIGCDKFSLVERFYPINILNNSTDTICFGLGSGGEFIFTQYPDTALPVNKPAMVCINQDIRYYTFHFRKPIDKIVEGLIADTLSIYIFSRPSYKNTPWETLRSNYMVLKRYDLSIADLKKLNYKVPYPPTIEMAGMKMYP